MRNVITTRKYVLVSTLYFGFASAIVQVLFIRELLSVFRGNEFIIGMIFSGWFIGIFLGARINPAAGADVLRGRISFSLIAFPLVSFALVYFAHLAR
jgi:hypothetical protein